MRVGIVRSGREDQTDPERPLRVGVIGGTGLYALGEGNPLGVETPYGEVCVDFLEVGGREVVFLPRHGRGHGVPPHRVNYRANVDALARANVDRVIAVNVVGSLREDVPPGALVVPDDYLDFSNRTDRTFFNDRAVHVDVSEPYCPSVRRALVDATERHAPGRVHDGGVYVATPGPRLETPAEVRHLRGIGGTVVGMTGCPEAALARERCLCYASLSVVTNHGAGLGAPLAVREIKATYNELEETVYHVLRDAVAALPEAHACGCPRALEGAGLSH